MNHDRTFDTSPAIKVFSTLPRRTSGEDAISRVRITIGQFLFTATDDLHSINVDGEVDRYADAVKDALDRRFGRDAFVVGYEETGFDSWRYYLRLANCGVLYGYNCPNEVAVKFSVENLNAELDRLFANILKDADAKQVASEHVPQTFEIGEVVSHLFCGDIAYARVKSIDNGKTKEYHVLRRPDAGDYFGYWELTKVTDQATIDEVNSRFAPAASDVEDRTECEPKPGIKIGDVVRYGTHGFHGIVTGIPSKPNYFVVKANPSASGGILDASKLRLEIDPEVIAQVKARFAPKAFVLSPEVPPRVRFIFEGSAFETSRIPSRDEAIDLCNRLNAFLKIIDHRAPTEDEAQKHFGDGKEYARVEFEGQIGKLTAQRNFLAKTLNDAAVDMEEGKKPLQVFAAIVRALHSYETTLGEGD